MAPDADPYRTLGLERGATLDEVKKAYRRLAKANHPDAAGEAALPRFLAIQAAYDQIAGPDGGPPTGRTAAARGARHDERGMPIATAPAPRIAPTAAGRVRDRAATRTAAAAGRHGPMEPTRRGGPTRRQARRPSADRRRPARRRRRRRSAPRRTTASRPRRSSPTGAARRGTARRPGRTGRSTPRNTRIHASTDRSTRHGPDGRALGPPMLSVRRPPLEAAVGDARRRRARSASTPPRPPRRRPPPAPPTPPTHTTSSWWEATTGETAGDVARPRTEAPPARRRTPRSATPAHGPRADDGDDLSVDAAVDSVRDLAGRRPPVHRGPHRASVHRLGTDRTRRRLGCRRDQRLRTLRGDVRSGRRTRLVGSAAGGTRVARPRPPVSPGSRPMPRSASWRWSSRRRSSCSPAMPAGTETARADPRRADGHRLGRRPRLRRCA